jgi:hypothetical protein
MKKFTTLIILILFLNSCGLLGDKVSPAASIDAFNTAEGTLIGSVFTIPAAGGSSSVPSATAKVTVPAGAMTAALSIQANTDMLDNEGQGIRLSGDWTKPITVEFAIPTGVTDPENYKIALRLDNGYWVTCRKAKINTANNTVQVRIAPSIRTKAARQARPMANSYSLALAKTFYLKPDRATVKLGEKVKFTAYAREGTVPVKWGNTVFNSKDDYDAAMKVLAELGDDPEPASDDDELVPLVKDPVVDNDPLEPLLKNVIAKEYVFTNKKEGFTRTWTAKSLGSITASGNAGADYTAPKVEAAKGKTVKVFFESVNNTSKRKANAEATVIIDDGIEKYKGTINIKTVGRYLGGTGILLGELEETWSSELYLKLYKDDKDQTIYKSDVIFFKSICHQYTEVYYSTTSGKEKDRKTQIGQSIGEGEKAGQVTIEIDKKTNKYTIKGFLETVGGNNTRVELIDGIKNTYSTTKYIGNRTTPLYVDIKNLIKPFDAKDKKVFKESIVALWDGNTYNTSWDFQKVE